MSKLSALFCMVGLCVGCGGAVFATPGDAGSRDAQGLDSASSDGATNDSSTRDSSPGDASPPPSEDASPPWSPACPPTLPALGSSCSQQGVSCEYEPDPLNVACSKVVSCEGGAWTSNPVFPSTLCTPDPGTNPSACPATLAAVPQGESCSPAGLECVYPSGVCDCNPPFGPIMVDGGGSSWGCLPEPGCPMPRPRLGSACTMEGQNCTYQQCSYAQACQSGVWQPEVEGCAEPGGSP